MAAAASLGCGLKLILLIIAASIELGAANYYVTISGLGGTPEYEAEFQKWAADLGKELGQNGADAHVEVLTGTAGTRKNIEQTFARLSRQVNIDDAFALFLIGHGTFDGVNYKFNVPGPDLTAGELSSLMNRVPARRQLVVNMTSCSGASLAALARKERIVITATKSGREKNAPVFARYWVDALRDPAADTDKNGTVSALETFRYAQQKTATYFESEKLLASEHAMFTDSGSKEGVRDPKPENHQGLVAAVFPLLRAEQTTSASLRTPAKQKLLSHKQELEEKIDRLKYQKPAMGDHEYKEQLASLLIDLARTQAELDK